MPATKPNRHRWEDRAAVQPDGSLWPPEIATRINLSKTVRSASDTDDGRQTFSKTFTSSELSYLGAHLEALEGQPRGCGLSIQLRRCGTEPIGHSRDRPIQVIRDLISHGFLTVSSTSQNRLVFTEPGKTALRIHLATRPVSLRNLYPRLRRRLGLPLDMSRIPPASLAAIDAEPVADFLRRLMIVAHAPPCVVSRRALLRLLWLAGLADTHLFRIVAKSGSDPLVTSAKGLLEAIQRARRILKPRDGRGTLPEVEQTGGLQGRHRRDDDTRSSTQGTRTSMAKHTSTTAASRPAAEPSVKAAPKTPPAAKTPPASRVPQSRVKPAPAPAASAKDNAGKVVSAKPAPPAKTTRSKAAPPSQPVKPTVTTLKHLAAELGGAHGLDPKTAHDVIAALFQSVAARLKAGDKVRLDGFGVIEVKARPARTGRNPATRESIQIAASRKLAFRPAKELKEAV